MTTDRITADYLVAENDNIVVKTWLAKLPILIIFGSVLFNWGLCFLYTAGFPVSVSHMMLVEMILVSLAFMYGFYNPDRSRYFWLMILIAQFVLLALLSVIRDEVMIKALRDIMIMPVFIAMGLAAWRVNLAKPLLWLSAFIGAVALFEAFYLELYTSFFNVKDYYILKGVDPLSFQYHEADIFVSGVRGSERFFPFPVEIHRISSVFLEPVSLGFYAFVSGFYFIAMKDRLPKIQVALALFLTVLLIWLGDARMACGTLVLVLLFRPLFARLDHRLTVFGFPAALITGLFIIESGFFSLDGEGIGARILWTFEGLANTGDRQFFGAADYNTEMVDSAFLYLLGSQGIFGFLLYWLPPIFFKSRLSKEARIYWYGASIFLCFGLMISYAIFTIKTAALLWFIYGYIIALTSQKDEETDSRQEVLP